MNSKQVVPSVQSDMLDDDARSEATFDFPVENFSRIKEAVFSSPTMIRNLPWKIMVMQKPASGSISSSVDSLGFFIQCNGESESSSWSCFADAQLIIVSQKEGVDNFTRKIEHLFHSKENDWGFSHFMTWSNVVNVERGFIKDDSVILRAHIVAEPREGVSLGYIGLKNQVNKTYISSFLQTLFFTNQLRKALYKIPTKNDDSRSLLLAMQNIFFDLQTESGVVDVEHFTRSLYAEALDLYAPHDLQKFIQLFFEKLECGMKCTPVEGTVSKLFSGKMKFFVTLNNIKFVTEKPQTFYDIQLNVNEKKNLNEAFRGYVPPELNVGEPSLQNAKREVIFESFPPVLHIHLKRFHHDPLTDCSVKFNDQFEFYEKLNLNSYLQRPESTPADYTLHAVLAHGGDYYSDQYVVFINPKGDGKWCKFVDEKVSECSKLEAITNNYGGQVKNSTCNAYLLVYIRDSELKNVLQSVTEEDIPNELKTRLEEERKITKNANSNEYVTINVFREQSPEEPNDVDQLPIRIFRMKSTTTIEQMLTMLSKSFNCPLDHIKMKPFNLNPDRTYECIDFEVDAQKHEQISNIAKSTVCNIFLEILI